MLRSAFCTLSGLTDNELTELGECPYDQVGDCPSVSRLQPHAAPMFTPSVFANLRLLKASVTYDV